MNSQQKIPSSGDFFMGKSQDFEPKIHGLTQTRGRRIFEEVSAVSAADGTDGTDPGRLVKPWGEGRSDSWNIPRMVLVGDISDICYIPSDSNGISVGLIHHNWGYNLLITRVNNLLIPSYR